MVVAAPHREAEAAGAAVLAEGGNAVDAAIAVAAALTVVYPHMTGLGGDGFWLIAEPGKAPVGIQACGPAAQAATPAWYRERGLASVLPRGGAAALTVAGAIEGWARARELSRAWDPLPLERLFADARRLSLQGAEPSRSQRRLLGEKNDLAPEVGALFSPSLVVQPRLAAVWDELSRGLDAFYRGDLARTVAADLVALGSPLLLSDLEAYRATLVEPLSVELSIGTVWNLPPPTQGVSSLALLGLFDRLGITEPGFDHVHGLVEATKAAFAWRNAHVGDPDRMDASPAEFLSPQSLDRLAASLDRRRASPWPRPSAEGDTVWFGVIDAQGRAVSVIQSLYWEFGAGVVLPQTGLLWQNRGASFTLEPGPNQLEPGRLPFHTLNPALARFTRGARAGDTVAYGTMGGEGQPQTQAALLTRYAWFGHSLEESVAAPRWLLGRTWGEDTTKLRVEGRFDAATVDALRAAGHEVEVVANFDDRMGHAGALVFHPDGSTEATHDPRADGGGLAVRESARWRLEGFLRTLAALGAETDGGVTRLLYDDAWSRARAWLAAEFARLGFAVRGDRVGNLYGRLEGTEVRDQVILTGSHFDTVRHGGWYDGAYGVAASAVALADLARRHGAPKHTVEVVAFCEEEGSRFPLAYWGSGHLAGRWTTEGERTDPQGVTLNQAMADAGFGRADQPDPRRNDLAAFVEIHIEQGIVLERTGTSVGIPDAIVGQRRWQVRLTGEANHAGTTPMNLRRDALAGAAEMMALVEAEAVRRGEPLVATVGFVEVSPNTPNVIPGTVAFSVDARHPDADGLEAFYRFLEGAFPGIAQRRGLGYAWEPRMAVPPVPLDPGLRRVIAEACGARALSHRGFPSGAGHDAQVIASLCPAAMIFIPSRHGISHSPLEHSPSQALADGLAVLTDVLEVLAWKGTAP